MLLHLVLVSQALLQVGRLLLLTGRKLLAYGLILQIIFVLLRVKLGHHLLVLLALLPLSPLRALPRFQEELVALERALKTLLRFCLGRGARGRICSCLLLPEQSVVDLGSLRRRVAARGHRQVQLLGTVPLVLDSSFAVIALELRPLVEAALGLMVPRVLVGRLHLADFILV